jgi:hypothetical protein
MVLLAATATGANVPTAALTLFLIVITVCYLVACAFWPFRPCRRCHGNGRHHGPFRGIRLCHHCHGTGLRLRLGRRAWNAARRVYREADRHR